MNKFILLPFGWSFYTGKGRPNSAISTAVTHARKFWRFYRTGPGLSRAAMLQLIALNAQRAAKQ